MQLFPGDACSFCWHNPKIQYEEGGIGTYNIGKLINYKGGIFDERMTCNICHVNYIQSLYCVHCKDDKPCYKHYSTVYNGTRSNNLNVDMHLLYMANSPYDKKWENRPSSIGIWYANICNSHEQAVQILKRFTSHEIVHFKLSYLYTGRSEEFWNGLYLICNEYFTGLDPVSRAVSSFYNTFYQKKF